jgi:protoporphyrinogen oxidase
MKVAIIGGGITGLTAAYELSKAGHAVSIFEKESYLGGLAYGYKQKGWDWSLEYAYHHLFTSDDAILSLAIELGLSSSLITKRPVTASLYDGKMYQLDSVSSLLSFPGLPFIDRVRTGVFLASLKFNPFWKLLEGYTAKGVAQKIGGNAECS